MRMREEFMENKNVNTMNEAILFYKELIRMGQDFYEYIHGKREEEEAAEAILRYCLNFYDADWIGLIDFDIDIGTWASSCFYSKRVGYGKEILIEDAENIRPAKRWVDAIRGGKPIIIEDVETIKESSPEEYEMYKRLKVESVLAVPYRNCGSGLFVLRNPGRFKSGYEALNIMSYIVTNEVVAKRRRDYICRKVDNSTPDTYDRVRINLFGGVSICSKDLSFDESDMKSDALQFLIGFLACNSNRFFSTEVLNEHYEGEKDVSWHDLIYKFRQKWKNARPEADDGYQLILTTEKGYGLNPNLKIDTDVSLAEGMKRVIEDATDVSRKIDLLKTYHLLFNGRFMGTSQTRNAFIRENRTHYKLEYIEKMKSLVEMLYNRGDYDGVEEYCAAVLKIYPRSFDMNYWRILALLQQGNYDQVESIERNLKEIMDEYLFLLMQRKILVELKLSEDNVPWDEAGNLAYLRMFDELRKFRTHD